MSDLHSAQRGNSPVEASPAQRGNSPVGERISIGQQIEAVGFAVTRQASLANGGSVRGMRGRSTEEYDVKRLQAALRTLEWVRANEGEIRAWIAAKKEAA